MNASEKNDEQYATKNETIGDKRHHAHALDELQEEVNA
jgi:hypothetical protein